DPGTSGNHLDGVAANGPDDVWAVGQRNGDAAGTDLPLVEHWDGRHWTVAPVPVPGGGAALLDGVAVRGNQVWAGRPDRRPDPTRHVRTSRTCTRATGRRAC